MKVTRRILVSRLALGSDLHLIRGGDKARGRGAGKPTAVFLMCFSLMLCSSGYTAPSDTMWANCADAQEMSVSSPTLKLLTLNASHGRSTAMSQMLVNKRKTYDNLDHIAHLLKASNADIVGLQEADAASRWSGKFDHVGYLARQSGYGCIVHGLHSQSWISTYGAALLSRTALEQPQSVRFAPSPPSKQKGYVSAELTWQLPGTAPLQVTVVSVHLDFLSKKTRDSQVNEMVAGLSEVDGPLIVLGDFNSDWSDDDSPVRTLAGHLGLRAYNPGADALGTYKKQSGKRLDWILVSPDLTFVEHGVLPTRVSDHFAVYAEVSYLQDSK